MAQYPEHDKLSKIQEQSQACGEFYDFLLETGIIRVVKPVPVSKLLGEFFNIDPDKLETEKRRMLMAIRRRNGGKDAP